MKNIDVIGIVALAFFLEKTENYKKALEFFEKQKIQTIESKNIDKKYYNTTAPVEERIKDLEEKFLNSKIDMIVSLDGGCTVIEMIDKVDYDMINKNKKIFTGFSDLTHLQIAMYTKSKLPSLYGMDIINGFGNNNEFTQKNINSFFNIINNKEEKIENYKKIDVNKEYTQAKKYWTNYLEKHDGLNLRENSNKLVNDRVKEIYKRTILLFPLLQNEETGGVSATVEIDENREKSGRYSYCWPRDAVFITKAFDYLNMKKETDKFYENFCKKTQSKNGMWEQRFYTDGTLAPCWGYQIDETASVIYGVYEHYKNTKELKFLQSNMKMCENALHFLFKYLEFLAKKKKKT